MAVGLRYYPDPNGGEPRKKYVVRYRDQNRKYRQGGTFNRKKDADAKDARIKVELQKGVHRPISTSPTISEIEPFWVDRATTDGLEPTVIEHFCYHFKLHIQPALAPPDAPSRWDGKLGDLKVAKLTSPMCEVFRRELLKSPLRDSHGRIVEGKRISRATARGIFVSFKALLKEAQAQNFIATNPAEPLRIKLSDRDRVPLKIGVHIPDRPDVRSLLLASTGLLHAYILTAAFAGLRPSELRALPWDNLDLDGHVIHVWQRADEKCNIGKCKTGAGYRDVKMPHMLVEELRSWKLVCPDNSRNLVFPSNRGTIFYHSYISTRMWAPLQTRIGMTRPDGQHKYRLNGLRHFYASLMIDQGVAPKRLQGLMGHASLQVTMDRYGHLFPMRKEETAQINDAAASVWAAE